jgi:hypothetical protein
MPPGSRLPRPVLNARLAAVCWRIQWEAGYCIWQATRLTRFNRALPVRVHRLPYNSWFHQRGFAARSGNPGIKRAELAR